MSCNRYRDVLTSAGGAPDRALERHLEACNACRRYARRLSAARTLLQEHHGGIEPDAAFAGRVAARLRTEPVDLLGQAALRLLPACLVLVLVLGWFALRTAPTPETTVVAPTDDLLTWVLENAGERP